MEDLRQEKDQNENQLLQERDEYQRQVKGLEGQVKVVVEERERFRQENDLMKTENVSLLHEKQELTIKLDKEKETIEKLRSSYDILKEHEFSLLRDFEGKKTREITFYEQSL